MTASSFGSSTFAHGSLRGVTYTGEIEDQQVRANGLEFHVASCGQGERLALCLHGFPECGYSWRHQLPLLASLGYRAWAPDQRGYGSSSRPTRMQDYAIENLMQDVAGLIDASGARDVVLLAHDWGAMVAWYFAMRRVRPLERLVIMNVPHPGAARLGLRQLLRSWYVFFFQIPRLPEWLLSRRDYRPIADAFAGMAIDKARFPEEVLRVYRENAARPGALTAMIHWYRAYVRGGGAARQRRLGHPVIETPTLMIWGERDSALGKETTFDTGAYVRDFTIRYLPDVSHWVQQEAPETVNAMLEAWLRNEPVPEARDLATLESPS
jgi:pimeloyl-ACP methyl ester carboxylesterase